MNANVEQTLIAKIKALSPEQRAQVEAFVEFLSAKRAKRAALGRLLAIAPALEAAGVEPLTEEEITAEVKSTRAQRRNAALSAARSDSATREHSTL
jgi:hypothetical protein